MTLILALDTSTPTGSIALRNEEGIVGLLTLSVALTHSQGLMPAVDALLRQAGRAADDLTALACVTGPGSYTGLRIGIATAQGLAFPRQLPCVGISSLTVLAWAAPHAGYPVCPLLSARKGWLYARLFQWYKDTPKPLTGEMCVEPDGLIQHIQEATLLYGPGLEPYRKAFRDMLGHQFIEAPGVLDLPRADWLAELAAQELAAGRGTPPAQLQPHYLGPSQAELNWKKLQTSAPPSS
ncbi:MAG TPA: tRNA (adenosine(37)-N6)-threonylcarbamoyltransferase complex dimerization subunit type 1 TsaB [bacterium]|nr:tRNA (adenosine(37)-N6)-threonylcarbamoyltransferase complex dimerization subunit type 1 TsaB [bacterium]